ncbi:hypothetical protein FRACYDRAFT_231246 [Fragilariopsis cylindrus CCMP1102]|uniref:Uncharacterized protein n=1 Tax=Fragilariopsis cylindrus CCMP1102 TaxID=635003 RepID=A0A1E7EJG1_9STRA|nr:hypothetical protein FRACYDRAFT_231246 [Fragilariopsis cylindrus CCMP1102]|eukprot:OEU06027.1 hypothetical protein FRACYDRAFT_231246 [Fragilariopsis cylindrus CCMP1102]
MPLIIDDYKPSAYEKKRLERIKKNEEHMKKLGLHKYQDFMKNTNTVSVAVKKKAVRIKSKKPVQRRRSGRLSFKSSNSMVVMLDLDQVDGLDKVVKQWDENDEDDDENDGDDNQNQNNNKSTVVTRRISINPDEYKLSDRDRISLFSAVEEGIVDEHYLSKFQEFLEYHDGISVQNVKNVMKQARKLASGDGIRYGSKNYGWPENCYFKKNIKITPLSDFIKLMNEGQEYENKYGRDRSNGWLLRHPLKKLLLFQHFILNNPSFLTSELKLKDYYA